MLASFSRLSLLWKILLSTSIALTLLFAVMGWIVQNDATHAMSASLDEEVQASFHAYDSLWRSRADTLAAVSLVISRMSDVRAAFSTGDQATIRDSAGELWKQISNQDSIFLVTDPGGNVLASLGGDPGESLKEDLPMVREAATSFPKQTSGFMTAGGHLYQIAVTPVYVQADRGMGLLNVLVAGYRVDQKVAQSLKESTGGSDFCFLAGGSGSPVERAVIASTLDRGVSSRVREASWPRSANGAAVRIEAGGTPYIMLSTPLLDISGKPIGELRILRSSLSARQRIDALRRTIVILWVFAVLVGMWLTHSLARRILKPVEELDRGASEVSHGNYDYRVPVEDPDGATRDELGRLAAAFNAMCESIQAGRQELIRQERVATIGRLSTSIVHDLRNPLAAIYGGAEMLIDGELSTGQVHRLAGNIYRSSRRMQQLLQELVDAGRGRTSSAEVCRMKDIVAAACEVFSATAEARSVTIETDVPEDLELPLERARIERVFLNLIDNALGMMPKGGRLRIAAQAEGSSVVVRVQDTGPGIPPQIRARLFQPFVTAGKKNGIGLGLAFSHQTVLDHGGKLWVDDTEAGACFLIQLPFSAIKAD